MAKEIKEKTIEEVSSQIQNKVDYLAKIMKKAQKSMKTLKRFDKVNNVSSKVMITGIIGMPVLGVGSYFLANNLTAEFVYGAAFVGITGFVVKGVNSLIKSGYETHLKMKTFKNQLYRFEKFKSVYHIPTTAYTRAFYEMRELIDLKTEVEAGIVPLDNFNFDREYKRIHKEARLLNHTDLEKINAILEDKFVEPMPEYVEPGTYEQAPQENENDKEETKEEIFEEDIEVPVVNVPTYDDEKVEYPINPLPIAASKNTDEGQEQ